MLSFLSSRRRHTISKRDWSSDVCLPIWRVVGGDVVDRSVLHRSPQGRNFRGPTVTVIGHDAVPIEVVGRCEWCEAFGGDPYTTYAGLFHEGKDRSADMHEMDVCPRVLGEEEYTGGRLDLVESALLDDLLLDLRNSPADPVASPQLLDLRIRQMHGDREPLALGLSQDVQQVPVIGDGQFTVVLMPLFTAGEEDLHPHGSTACERCELLRVCGTTPEQVIDVRNPACRLDLGVEVGKAQQRWLSVRHVGDRGDPAVSGCCG